MIRTCKYTVKLCTSLYCTALERVSLLSYPWPGIVTGPRSPHLSAYLHMLHNHVACKLRGCRSRVRVHACGVQGTLCRFVFARLRSFRVVLCRPFSFPWRIISQKCPHQLFLPFLDRLRRHRCLRSSTAQRRSPEQAPRETERLTSMFGFCAEHRQGSSPSVLSRGVLQQSGILVVWSHFQPSNVVLKSNDSTSHTVREIDCCTAFVLRSCSVVQVRQQLIGELGSRGYSW